MMRIHCPRMMRLRRSENCWIASPRGGLSSRASFETIARSTSNSPRQVLFSSSVAPGGGGGVSKRDFAQLEDALHRAAGSVVDPVVGRSLSSLQWLDKRLALSEDGRALRMLLRMPSLLHPRLAELKDRVREAAEAAMRASPIPIGAERATVEAIAARPVPFAARLLHAQGEEGGGRDEVLAGLGPGLAGVAHVVAVYSCKGGVGKSTVAVNLAYQLARMGGRVGLLDLDVYGPSLPVLVRPNDAAVRRSPLGEGMVLPVVHENVKLLSLGFVNMNSGVPGSGQGNGAAVMRGPMAGKVVTQLLKGTDWGDLDVLVLDLPPGTGDVQLQVLQDAQLSGAVAVTTPSRLAAVDTAKGIEMFTSLGVPTLAVVENMAYFVCEGGTRHYPFGKGIAEQGEEGRLPVVDGRAVVQLPISAEANDANDAGVPLCLSRKEAAAEELGAFGRLADVLCEELLKLQYAPSGEKCAVSFSSPLPSAALFDVATLQLSKDRASDALVVRLYGDLGAIQRKLSPAQLRSRDPQSGQIIADSPFLKQAAEEASGSASSMLSHHRASGSGKKEKTSPSLSVTRVERKGRYGYAVQYADGATVIYSSKSLALAAGGELVEAPPSPSSREGL